AGKAIIETAKRSNKIVAAAEQCFRSVLARTVRWIFRESKLIGEPRLFYAQQVAWHPPAPPERAPRWHWRIDRFLSGGGILIDSGVHFIHTMRTFFGEVESVYAQVKQLCKRPHRKDDQIVEDAREDTWMAILNFASGVVGFWSFSMSAPGHPFTHVVYYGTEGALIDSGDIFHGPFRGAYIHRADGRVRRISDLQHEFIASLSEDDKQRLFPHGLTDTFALECYDFLHAVQTGCEPEVPAEDGMRDQAVALALYESSITGEAVKVQDVLDGKLERYQQDINEYWGL
ncbi:MAG TPA: Gfo/Idh/MocA family oxidoreductase, partial [Armatimonadetes bacterium]|nr:Gfo/Idh/MocA family oxidoreductase [Armatimonadota bacterium]